MKALKEMYRWLMGMPFSVETLASVTPRWLACKISDPVEQGGLGLEPDNVMWEVGGGAGRCGEVQSSMQHAACGSGLQQAQALGTGRSSTG